MPRRSHIHTTSTTTMRADKDPSPAGHPHPGPGSARVARLPHAADLVHALHEARAIADGVSQELSTTHIVLALFTVSNPAELVLREAFVDEDRLLALVGPALVDEPDAVGAVLSAAEETALRCDARSTNTLHLLVALLKVREGAAWQLLESALGGTATLRNRVMAYVTGVLPRRLQQSLQEALQEDRVDVGGEPAPPVREKPRARVIEPRRGDDWVVSKKTMLDGFDPAPPAASAVSVVDVTPVEDPALPRPVPAPVRPQQKLDAPPEEKKPQKRREPPPPSIALTLPPTAFDLDPDRFPWLTSLGRNLTSMAVHGSLDPSVGRAAELEQLIDVLGKRRANNPCLVGDPGVGKTAIVEGLAVKLMRGDVDVAPLHGKVIIELDMGRIVAGTSLRGSFSERMQGLKRDVLRSKGHVIVFIDEIHTLMGAGASGEGPQDAANELKAALARGDFPCIGSTTIDEYRKYIEQDPALERRFVKILVEEPSDEEAIQILQGAAPLYAKHHGVTPSSDAIAAAVQLSSRFIHDKKLPAKALDLLDLSLSRGRRSGLQEIGREDVARVAADVAKVPLDRVLAKDQQRFMEMEKGLGERVIGHEHVVLKVAHTIRRNYAGFSTHRPMGSFLFLGPSGVGKTELAKALADFLFGTEKALLRLDMSEFSEPHTVARLTGAPPGYVGHDDGGQLTEAIRRRPHAVVLLDEIEKAHPDVLPVLLQVLDEGRLTDSQGRTVTFRHAVLIMTSNLGSAALAQINKKPVGFAVDDASSPLSKQRELARIEDAVLSAARKHFIPELWGRIEDKCVFASLSTAELCRIAALQLEQSARALMTTRSIGLKFDEPVLAFLVEQSTADAGNAALGARPLRQVIQRLVETPVSEAILRGEVKDGARIRLAVVEGRLVARAARR
ncbi:MAG: ATP-dependent Clp protease ATP-binding subunit [Deltaproteobacteria bacterium]|nr:ATP-dependent Clp protease ATP-binding subunit [Deltaproteobacteria bacterium]